MEQILEMITTYGLETVAIALIINVLTGFEKNADKIIGEQTERLHKSNKIYRVFACGIRLFYFLLIRKIYQRSI